MAVNPATDYLTKQAYLVDARTANTRVADDLTLSYATTKQPSLPFYQSAIIGRSLQTKIDTHNAAN